MANREPVTDHEYWGNVCIGFGGRSECRELTRNGMCNRPVWEHDYRPPKHRDEDAVETFQLYYKGRHAKNG